MPILVRPVREQIEHDRVIRQLQTKWRRKYRADINPGDERAAGVQVGTAQLYPDLVLTAEGQKKPAAVVEVETGESVNHLEAMSQWASFAKSRIPFYLFVPAGSLDSARRLVTDHQIDLTELWTYFVIGEQIRFTPVIRAAGPSVSESVAEKGDKFEKFERFDRVEKVEQVEKVEHEQEQPEVVAAVAEKPAKPEKPQKVAAKAGKTEKAEKIEKEQAGKLDKVDKLERVAKAEKREPAAARGGEAERERERPRPRAAEPKRQVAAARPSAPPRRKAAAPTKRAVAPKRGSVRGVAPKRAAAKRPARSAATKRASASATSMRRPAKTARPGAKRARAQKRK